MRLFISCIIAALFFSCNDQEKVPDVSKININITTKRFEKELFTLDSTQLKVQLPILLHKYGNFSSIFMEQIINADASWNTDSITNYVKGYLSSNSVLFDSSNRIFNDFSNYEKQIIYSLKLVKYYFNNYKIPKEIITYIGPLDGFGDAISDDAILVGLHHHLGKDSKFYDNEYFHQTYPAYISNRFDADYIVVKAMTNIVSDIYPENNNDGSLAVKMVEKGKRLYILEKLLPNNKPYQIIGYTEKQFNDCKKNEAVIWDFFTKNNLLQNIENNIIKNYLGEGPKTQELGEASPGNIGSFVGWQIVNKYMSEHKNISLKKLMETNSEELFESAKYKP